MRARPDDGGAAAGAREPPGRAGARLSAAATLPGKPPPAAGAGGQAAGVQAALVEVRRPVAGFLAHRGEGRLRCRLRIERFTAREITTPTATGCPGLSRTRQALPAVVMAWAGDVCGPAGEVAAGSRGAAGTRACCFCSLGVLLCRQNSRGLHTAPDAAARQQRGGRARGGRAGRRAGGGARRARRGAAAGRAGQLPAGQARARSGTALASSTPSAEGLLAAYRAPRAELLAGRAGRRRVLCCQKEKCTVASSPR